MATLTDWLKANPHKGFAPKPVLHEGFLTYFSEDSRCYAVTVDKYFTLYKSIDNDKIVGCKVYIGESHA